MNLVEADVHAGRSGMILRALALVALPIALAWLLWDGLIPRLWSLQLGIGGALVGIWACAVAALAVRSIRGPLTRPELADERTPRAAPSQGAPRSGGLGRHAARTLAWSLGGLVMLMTLLLCLLQLWDGRVGTATRILQTERVLPGGATLFVFRLPRLMKPDDTALYLAQPAALTMQALATVPGAGLEGSEWLPMDGSKVRIPFVRRGALNILRRGPTRFEIEVDPARAEARRRPWSRRGRSGPSVTPEVGRAIAAMTTFVAPKALRCLAERGAERLAIHVEIDASGAARIEAADERLSPLATACVAPLVAGRTIFPQSGEAYVFDYEIGADAGRP